MKNSGYQAAGGSEDNGGRKPTGGKDVRDGCVSRRVLVRQSGRQHIHAKAFEGQGLQENSSSSLLSFHGRGSREDGVNVRNCQDAIKGVSANP